MHRNPKISAAVAMITERAPILAQALAGHEFVEGEGMPQAAFTIQGNKLVFDVDSDASQSEITFALGVAAYMIANEIGERGAGRDIVLWAIASNTSGQAAVSKFLTAPEKATEHLERFHRRFPGIDPDLPLEDLYAAMLSRKGVRQTAPRLN